MFVADALIHDREQALHGAGKGLEASKLNQQLYRKPNTDGLCGTITGGIIEVPRSSTNYQQLTVVTCRWCCPIVKDVLTLFLLASNN